MGARRRVYCTADGCAQNHGGDGGGTQTNKDTGGPTDRKPEAGRQTRERRGQADNLASHLQTPTNAHANDQSALVLAMRMDLQTYLIQLAVEKFGVRDNKAGRGVRVACSGTGSEVSVPERILGRRERAGVAEQP